LGNRYAQGRKKQQTNPKGGHQGTNSQIKMKKGGRARKGGKSKSQLPGNIKKTKRKSEEKIGERETDRNRRPP